MSLTLAQLVPRASPNAWAPGRDQACLDLAEEVVDVDAFDRHLKFTILKPEGVVSCLNRKREKGHKFLGAFYLDAQYARHEPWQLPNLQC